MIWQKVSPRALLLSIKICSGCGLKLGEVQCGLLQSAIGNLLGQKVEFQTEIGRPPWPVIKQKN